MNRHVPPEETSRVFNAAGGRAATDDRAALARRHFRAARRHSRWVRFLRFALPVSVFVAGGLTLAYILFDPLRIAVDLPFELGRVSLEGTRVKMELPKLSGFTTDNRGYSVTAKSASQDLANPDQIDLEQIEARLELAEKGWATLTAQAGHYNTKSENMTLDEGIVFDTSAGYGGTLKEVKVDVKSGKLVSDQPVELRYLDGKLTADRMEVSQKDSTALLTGRVQLVFRMPQPEDRAQASAAAPPVENRPSASASPAPVAPRAAPSAPAPTVAIAAPAAAPVPLAAPAPAPGQMVLPRGNAVPLPPARPPVASVP